MIPGSTTSKSVRPHGEVLCDRAGSARIPLLDPYGDRARLDADTVEHLAQGHARPLPAIHQAGRRDGFKDFLDVGISPSSDI